MVNALRLIMSGEKYLPRQHLASRWAAAGADPAGQARRHGRPPVDELSAREAEILGLLVTGRTNKEIAVAARTAGVTVKVHLRGVYRKIGAANRAQAVRIILDIKGRLR